MLSVVALHTGTDTSHSCSLVSNVFLPNGIDQISLLRLRESTEANKKMLFSMIIEIGKQDFSKSILRSNLHGIQITKIVYLNRFRSKY